MPLFLSLTIFLATVSPSPSTDKKDGIIVCSSATCHTFQSLLYKSILSNLIPLADDSKQTLKQTRSPTYVVVALNPLFLISSTLALIESDPFKIVSTSKSVALHDNPD